MRKTGISVYYGENPPKAEQFKLLKQAGFDCLMLNYFEGDDIEGDFSAARNAGLEIANIHAPISRVNSVWEEGLGGDEYIDLQKERVDFCSRENIPVLVLHTTFLKNPPPVTQTGLDRHMRLCDYAEAKGVHLAFENVEPYPHLHEVMKNAGEFHGFCWDIGHNLAYAPETDFSSLYGDRIIAVHIHDNFGVRKCGNIDSADDMHLLPFDGSLDWSWWAERIKSSAYDGAITLEFSPRNKPIYSEMSFSELAKKAFERADRLRKLADVQ